MLRPPLRTLGLSALVVLGACLPFALNADDPGALTTGYLRDLQKGLLTFRDSAGLYPASLAPLCPYDDDQKCWFSRSVHLKDGWGRPFTYNQSAGHFVLRSAGRDGAFGTSDDLVLDSAVERAVQTRTAGCYAVAMAPGTMKWLTRLRLLADTLRPAYSPIAPDPPLPYRSAFWEVSGPDSIALWWVWQHGSLQTSARVRPDSLVGAVREHGVSLLRGLRVRDRGALVAVRVDCDSRTTPRD